MRPAPPIALAVAVVVAVAAVAAAPSRVAAQGSPNDSLNAPGTPTDRYLDSDEVRDVLHAATEPFFFCFRDHARTGIDASDAGVTFEIGRDGKATEVFVEVGSAPPVLAECLAGVVTAQDFGEHDGDAFEVSYPLVYQVDRKGARVLPYPVVFTRPVPVRLPLLQLPADVRPGEVKMLELILVDDPEDAPEAPPEDPPAPPPQQEAPATE